MADKSLPFKYCLSCEEEVYSYTVRTDGGIEFRCSSCGLPLGLEPGAAVPGSDCILIADGDPSFRLLLARLLDERGLATTVISCESGTAFLTAAADRFHQELLIKMAILAITMSPLDGISAALALRALEEGLQVAHPTPVLFLSAVRCDDGLRALIGRCQPALYLNKGSVTTPDQLGPILEKVVGHLFHPVRR